MYEICSMCMMGFNLSYMVLSYQKRNDFGFPISQAPEFVLSFSQISVVRLLYVVIRTLPLLVSRFYLWPKRFSVNLFCGLDVFTF